MLIDQVIELLEGGDDLEHIEITMFPPNEEGNVAEEDSDDDENGDMNSLPPAVLRSEVLADITLRDGAEPSQLLSKI